MMSTISLCIPAYNAARFLPALFESVQKQEISFHEVLLYDDQSADNTSEIALSFGAKVIKGNENKGCSFGKNELAKIASGDWIFFLDADDILYPHFTSVVKRAISNNPSGEMIILAYDYVDFDSGIGKNRSALQASDLKEDAIRFMINNKIVNSSVVKREAFNRIGGFDLEEKLLFVEDRAFSLKTALAGVQISLCDEVVFRINYFPESMSAKDPSKWIEASIYLFEKVDRQTRSGYAHEIACQLYQNAVWAAKFKKWQLVQKSVNMAIKINPGTKPAGSKFFQILYSLNPLFAFAFRRRLMSIVKPRFYE